MPDAPMVNLYRGKRVEDMSREELIAAVTMLGGMLNTIYENQKFIAKLRAENYQGGRAGQSAPITGGIGELQVDPHNWPAGLEPPLWTTTTLREGKSS